ncbi:monooxygenase [Chrysochromulina tobinii]|uniref:Monooxygenase n=1 Tax=Chrysochromulina tobinii TaxID=1460289 RepID=A0A0M0J627_9EUKA|nr:monooxygenase [Chrysochromulina tobinii]|eukprot:KOO22041.1 monooxygenase [Chrysochromulina sp. CCMP291]
MFKTKHEVRDYMNRYAQNKGLAQCMSFGETVLRISHEPEVDKDRPWRVATDKRELRARRVVVATGLNRQPHIPHIPGSEERAAHGARALRHSWSVSSCDEYKGERVLLVGSGNSAAELAVALHHSGAKSIDILVDGPRHFVRRSTMGQIFRLFPYLSLSTESMVHDLHRCTFGEHTADAKVVTAWERFQEGQDEFIRLLSVDLGPFGIQRPPSWRHAEQQSVAPRIPVYDVDQQRLPRSAGEGGIVGGSAAVGYGVIDLIMSGAVGIKRGRIQRFTSTGVVIEEGASLILATGFRHRMADFLCAKDGLLHTAASFGAADDAEGAPIIDSCSRSRVIDSIYFVGMDQFRSTASLDWPP